MKKAAFAIALLLCSTFGMRAQVPVALSPLAKQQFLSIAGVPLAGGCVGTFITGTSTPLATYTDGTGLATNPNPIILDGGGFANIWLKNASYRFTVTSAGGVNCSTGTFQYTVDNVSAYTVINQANNLFLLGASSDPSGSAGELAYRTDIPCFRGFSTLWDCFVTLTGTQTLTNKTISNGAYSGAQTGFVGTSPVLNNPNVNGTVVNGPPATYLVMANDLATGTALNKLAKINPTGLAGFAILPLISDTGGVTGIVVSGAGNTGNATIQQNGSASCVFDNAVTSGDYVQISSSIAGDCHDTGVNYPTAGQAIGRVLATNVAAGTYVVDLFGPEIKPPQNNVVAVNLAAQAANIVSTPILTPAANGYYRFSCYVVITQAATTSSALPSCNVIWTDAETSVLQPGVQTSSNSAATNNTLGFSSISLYNPVFFAKAATSINYQTTAYASVGGTPMQYALHIRLEGPF